MTTGSLVERAGAVADVPAAAAELGSFAAAGCGVVGGPGGGDFGGGSRDEFVDEEDEEDDDAESDTSSELSCPSSIS